MTHRMYEIEMTSYEEDVSIKIMLTKAQAELIKKVEHLLDRACGDRSWTPTFVIIRIEKDKEKE